jgi:hypothetical protein
VCGFGTSHSLVDVPAQNVAALVSIGGWTGSRFFSSALGSAANRTAFVQTVTTFAAKYQLDGLDFEYVSIPRVTFFFDQSGTQLGISGLAGYRLQHHLVGRHKQLPQVPEGAARNKCRQEAFPDRDGWRPALG